MIVQKQVFELDRLDLFCGTTLKQVRVGYETYGTLSPSKDNAILICHHFSGTSHAAGRYNEIEEIPGYWDAVIGPGKPFDTHRYFVVSSDTLCNINVKDPTVVTTGPAESTRPFRGRDRGKGSLSPVTGGLGDFESGGGLRLRGPAGVDRPGLSGTQGVRPDVGVQESCCFSGTIWYGLRSRPYRGTL